MSTDPSNSDDVDLRRRCVLFIVYVVCFIMFCVFLFNSLYIAAAVVGVVMILCSVLIRLRKRKKVTEWRPTSPSNSIPGEQPMYIISSSVPLASATPSTPSRPGHLPSMSQPRDSGQLIPPTPTTDDPLSQPRLSLSSQLSHAYYGQTSSFSSPFIAPRETQTLDLRNSINPSSAWPSTSSSSDSLPFYSSPSRFAGHVDVEAATQLAVNAQPPAYPEVVDENGPSPHPYMIPTTDEGSGKVFGPSTDGLPSYEAAMSTWQPPADETHPTSRDVMPND